MTRTCGPFGLRAAMERIRLPPTACSPCRPRVLHPSSPAPQIKGAPGRSTASVPIHLRLVNPAILRISGPQPLTFCCICDCVAGITAYLELAVQMSQSLCCTCLAIHENITMKMPLGTNMPADAWLPLSKCRQLHSNHSMYEGRPAPYGVP
jgi:hypothetical protein